MRKYYIDFETILLIYKIESERLYIISRIYMN